MCTKSIRSFYAPVQPTAERAADAVDYQELAPVKGLHDFIYCYWQLKTVTPLPRDFSYGGSGGWLH